MIGEVGRDRYWRRKLAASVTETILLKTRGFGIISPRLKLHALLASNNISVKLLNHFTLFCYIICKTGMIFISWG